MCRIFCVMGWKNTSAGLDSHLRLWLRSIWQRLSAPSGIFKWVSAGNKHSCAVDLQALHPHLFVSMHMCLFVMYTSIGMRLSNRRSCRRKNPLHLKVWACTRRCGSVNVFSLTPVCLDAGSCALLGEQLTPPGCSSTIHLLDSQRRVCAPTCTLSLPPSRPPFLPLSFTRSCTRPDCHKQAPAHMRSPIQWRSGMLGLQCCRTGVCVCMCVCVCVYARAYVSVLKVPICV